MCNTVVNLTLAMSAIGTEKPQMSERNDVDVLLIGAGVMSATLGAWLQGAGGGLDRRDGRAAG
nr:malate:quinone oxidoreductase [Candidatus Pantoea persica]